MLELCSINHNLEKSHDLTELCFLEVLQCKYITNSGELYFPGSPMAQDWGTCVRLPPLPLT